MAGRLSRMCVVVVLLFFVVSCGGSRQKVRPERSKRPKRERAFYRMMMQSPVNDEIFYEDEWFTYRLELERVVRGRYYMPSSSFGGECRYQGATYTVFDKELSKVVRVRHIDSEPCNKCHPR